MIYVRIKLNAETLDGEILEKYVYNSPLLVLEDNEDNIAVIYNKSAYWFSKANIERYI